MDYARAKRFADRLLELLTPHRDLINIAGSFRRQLYQVKDIE